MKIALQREATSSVLIHKLTIPDKEALVVLKLTRIVLTLQK